ncbi:MAG: DUF6261 family protein [Bacteroidales bacterium]|nr:DUF6261 family protein [Bacteroidales bacterium]
MGKTTPYFGSYNQSECIQYLLDAEELCKRHENKNLDAPLQTFNEGNTDMVKAFKKERKSNITKLLTQYDQRRDDAIVCLSLVARAYSNHFDAEIRDAAETVLNTIDKYGKSLHRLNYQSQTSVLSNLYNDLTTETGVTALAKIHMTDVAEEMQTSNNLFNETYLARVEESAAQDQIATGELIKVSIDNYRHLVSIIEAYHTIKPDDGYDVLLKQLNELAAKYNGLISSTGANEEDSEEQES